ncbi:MAG: class I SAM-dependent methyltransferase [Myxococcota bacterium]|nr:class I SAM-dependent methyltransferase [Myxococcota bacterium]
MPKISPPLSNQVSNEQESEVRRQYEDYPFPRVVPDDEKRRLVVTPQDTLSKISHFCFEGKANFNDNFRVLVAGGGTGHALIFLAEQLSATSAEIVYLDLSAQSMQIAQERAKIRKLRNIQWHRGSILQAPDLNLGQFDYINCTGVLHHLPDPTAGLQALKNCLKPSGAMGLMVYGKYGRTGIYQIQELMRLVNSGLTDNSSKVENTINILKDLPVSHWQLRGKDKEQFLDSHLQDHHDIFDLFLHSKDQAYSVPEVYDYIETCGLKVNAFTHFHPDPTELLKYEPRTFIKDKPLLERIRSFPKRNQMAVAELLSADISLHTFYVSFRHTATACINNLDNIPYLIHATSDSSPVFSTESFDDLSKSVAQNPNKPLIIRNPIAPSILVPYTKYLASILQHLGGENTIEEIIQMVQREFDAQNREAHHPTDIHREIKQLYHALHSIGWMFLRHRSMPGPPCLRKLNKIKTSSFGHTPLNSQEIV